MAAAGERARSSGVLGRGDLAVSLILIFPLFLAYQVGVMFSASINGVDFVTRTLLGVVGYDRSDYLLLHLALAAVFLLVVLYARQRRELSRALVLPLLFESAIYALTLGSFIILVMQDLLGFFTLRSADIHLGETGEAVIIALGAGVHEELVFRLGAMAGGAWLLVHLGMYARYAVPIMLFVSALAFSLAHHLGPYGEVFRLDVFTYRVLAGAIFGLVFYYRSLAHAVYTHFLYDLYVLVIRS